MRADIASTEGAIILSSRVSVEMVQKAAAIGAPIIIAMSTPIALAVRVAEEAEMTVVAVARSDVVEIVTPPSRFRTKGTCAGSNFWPAFELFRR